MAPAAADAKSNGMTYRFLGDSGLLVSKLSLGSWMDVNDQYTADAWYAMMKLAFQHGVNFFDNAEAYGGGLAERNMGAAINKGVAEGTWSREDLVISTKIFFGSKPFGSKDGPNAQGLSRKHIVEGAKASLKRLDQQYVDVIFCHRPDPFTPIEETVRAMNFVINQGWAFYWGTSQWSAAQIVEACEIADRLGLIRPVVEQPVYSILDRNKVEFEYVDLYKKYKLGLTTWSPLAYGALTGKYSAGTPEGSRMESPLFKAFTPDFADRVEKADRLKPVADKLGISLAELALAWCVSNENVSTVMVGAKTLKQLEQNLKAIEAVDKITPEIKAEIDALIPFTEYFKRAVRAAHVEAHLNQRTPQVRLEDKSGVLLQQTDEMDRSQQLAFVSFLVAQVSADCELVAAQGNNGSRGVLGDRFDRTPGQLAVLFVKTCVKNQIEVGHSTADPL